MEKHPNQRAKELDKSVAAARAGKQPVRAQPFVLPKPDEPSLDAQLDKALAPFGAEDDKPAQAPAELSALVKAEVEKATKPLRERIAMLETVLFSGIKPGELQEKLDYLGDTEGVVKRLEDMDTTLFSGLEDGELPDLLPQFEKYGGLVATVDRFEDAAAAERVDHRDVIKANFRTTVLGANTPNVQTLAIERFIEAYGAERVRDMIDHLPPEISGQPEVAQVIAKIEEHLKI
jgi:hypothetical protein